MPIEVPFIKELLDAAEAKAAAELEKATREAAAHSAREERRSGIAEILDVRFGKVPEAVVARLREISDLAKLSQLHRASAVCADLAEFERRLAE